MNEVRWTPTRRGGFIGEDSYGRVFPVRAAAKGKGWDVFWLPGTGRAAPVWVCRSVTSYSACAKLQTVLDRESVRKAQNGD